MLVSELNRISMGVNICRNSIGNILLVGGTMMILLSPQSSLAASVMSMPASHHMYDPAPVSCEIVASHSVNKDCSKLCASQSSDQQTMAATATPSYQHDVLPVPVSGQVVRTTFVDKIFIDKASDRAPPQTALLRSIMKRE